MTNQWSQTQNILKEQTSKKDLTDRNNLLEKQKTKNNTPELMRGTHRDEDIILDHSWPQKVRIM